MATWPLKAVAIRHVRQVTEQGEAFMRKIVGVQGSPSDRSAPGEPPRRQKGTLQAGVTSRVFIMPNRVVGEVWSAAVKRGKPYPLFLEMGAFKGGRARPHVLPTLEFMRERAVRTMGAPLTHQELGYLAAPIRASWPNAARALLKMKVRL